MHSADDNPIDRQIASFLAAADKNAAPPDHAFLEQLRAQSTHAFLAAAAQQSQRQRRRRLMISRSVQALAASLAAAVLIGVVVFAWLSPDDSGLAFGHVLDRVAASETLHLRVTRHGRAASHPARVA